MKLKLNKIKNTFGFTTIEVMIVLAIVGVIMIVVFIAATEPISLL